MCRPRTATRPESANSQRVKSHLFRNLDWKTGWQSIRGRALFQTDIFKWKRMSWWYKSLFEKDSLCQSLSCKKKKEGLIHIFLVWASDHWSSQNFVWPESFFLSLIKNVSTIRLSSWFWFLIYWSWTFSLKSWQILQTSNHRLWLKWLPHTESCMMFTLGWQ